MGTVLREKTTQPLGDSLSIAEVNQLKDGYNNLVQELSELKSGILMLAQLVNIDIPEDYKSEDLISELAGWVEDLQNESQESKEVLSVLTSSDFLNVLTSDEPKSQKAKQIQEILKNAQLEIRAILSQKEG
jgi:hypothetical protein